HEYFSHGIAFASCVYLPSRPFIMWMNSPRQPVVGACARTGAASDIETAATTTAVNIERRHVIRGYSGVKDMCVKLRRHVELEQRVQQDVGAVADVRWTGIFLRRMTDPADARDEDHPHRTDLREVLRVVTRSARHGLVR